MAEGALWADSERARATVAEVKSLKGWLEPYHALRKRVDEGRELNDLLEAESHVDLALQRSLETEAEQIGDRLESLEMQNMLRGPDDARDALLTIVAAVSYLVDPFDLIPDEIPFLGFVDDATVIGFAVTRTKNALDEFMLWETRAE